MSWITEISQIVLGSKDVYVIKDIPAKCVGLRLGLFGHIVSYQSFCFLLRPAPHAMSDMIKIPLPPFLRQMI